MIFGREQKKKPQGIGIVGRQGPSGERGKTGDHGQHGDTGQTGETGETGEAGDRGARGLTGDTGSRGAQGAQGEKGRSLTLWQALAIFFVVTAVAVSLSVRTEIQQRKIESQQREIAANTEKIQEARYQGCLGGVIILDKFNKQMEALAAVEQTLVENGTTKFAKDLGEARIKAYREGETLPLPVCER